MSVRARITAIKAGGESIVTRESASRVHVDITNGIDSVEVILRADGRCTIEVKNGQAVVQYLNLTRGYTNLPNSTIIDGKMLA